MSLWYVYCSVIINGIIIMNKGKITIFIFNNLLIVKYKKKIIINNR